MKLSRGREYKLNMGNYEHLQVSAMVTVDILDVYTPEEVEDMSPDEQMAALRAHAERYLDEQLEPELVQAAKVSQAEKSILPEPDPEPEPPKRQRVQRRSRT